MKKPLDGVMVLDLTQAYSGPFCTMHLADQGAEVIKVESPRGDQSRTWGPLKNGYSAYYAYINRNKKGIVLDLKKDKGKKILWDLIKKADVMCENFRPGTLERLGFPYAEIEKVNPKLIYASISGYGLNGPLSNRPAYDIVTQAMSGMMSVTGYSNQPGVKVGPSIADNYSGTYLSLGICMALYQRERTGHGQKLDVAMLDTLFSIMENYVVMYTVGNEIPGRRGNIDSGIAPFDSYQAADGEFVLGCGTDKMWAILCKLMNKEELIENPLYRTNDDRCRNYEPNLKEIIEEWSKGKTVAELESILVEAGIPFGRINNIKQACTLKQIAARNMLWQVRDPGIGEIIEIPGTPIKMHGTVDNVSNPAPLMGQDTTAVLKKYLDLTDVELQCLLDEDIVQ
ncbi:MAG: CoA transferase [Clostridia bacterium]|nr:CoA transferase [Peptococcus niger]MDU7243834.1 CoA transferase [Clostridiales bacterium]MDU7504952.1 CoA transferase [Clostridia bacterium]